MLLRKSRDWEKSSHLLLLLSSSSFWLFDLAVGLAGLFGAAGASSDAPSFRSSTVTGKRRAG